MRRYRSISSWLLSVGKVLKDMSEEKKLSIISTIKRLHRPCTTLDLARNLSMTRTEANPLLYEFQKQGLIEKVQEGNPPKWNLTPAGQLYGIKKCGAELDSFGCGRGINRTAGIGLGHLGLDVHGHIGKLSFFNEPSNTHFQSSLHTNFQRKSSLQGEVTYS